MLHWELVAAKVVTMTLGFLIAYQAYKGFRRYDSPPMVYVAIGFAFVSIGAVVEGLLVEVLDFSLLLAGTIQTSIVAVGFLFVLYSLYGRIE